MEGLLESSKRNETESVECKENTAKSEAGGESGMEGCYVNFPETTMKKGYGVQNDSCNVTCETGKSSRNCGNDCRHYEVLFCFVFYCRNIWRNGVFLRIC